MPAENLKISVGGPDPQYLKEHVQQARHGDEKARHVLASELANNLDLWKASAEQARCSEQAIIERMAAGDAARQQALTETVNALKAELAGSVSSRGDRLLVDWVVQSLLQCWEADGIYPESGKYTTSHAAQALACMNSANFWLLAAIGELAMAAQADSGCGRVRHGTGVPPGPATWRRTGCVSG